MKWTILLLMLILLPGIAMAEEVISVPAVEYDISQWEQTWQNLPLEVKSLFGGMSIGQILESYRSGAAGIIDAQGIKKAFLYGFKEAFGAMGTLIGAAIIMGLLDIIIGGKEGIGEMLLFCIMGLCISSITKAVYSQFSQAAETVNGISRITEMTSPVMMTLVAACGSAKTAASLPGIILLCNAITNGFKKLVMPLIPIMCGFTAASCITGQGQLKAMADLLKSVIKWSMGMAFTFFLGSVSIRSLNASGLDRAGIKAIKYAFDKSVPVVGGMISGTYDGLLAGAVVLKNAAGTAAVILLILSALTPGIAMLSIIFALKITGAVCGLFSDKRISGMLEGAAESCTYMFAVAATAALMNLITISATLIASGI